MRLPRQTGQPAAAEPQAEPAGSAREGRETALAERPAVVIVDIG
ncbi:MAG TPA: hypothetical protein VFR64_04905 [Methylomirabilota bacterium]|nr:hypothetical protein [Methylomirabilota bacterium]